MQPKVKSIFSPTLAEMELPSDVSNCEVQFELEIGPEDTDISELFGFTVISTQRLEQTGLPRWGAGLLIVDDFSWDSVAQALSQTIASATRETWAESVVELRKTFSAQTRSMN